MECRLGLLLAEHACRTVQIYAIGIIIVIPFQSDVFRSCPNITGIGPIIMQDKDIEAGLVQSQGIRPIKLLVGRQLFHGLRASSHCHESRPSTDCPPQQFQHRVLGDLVSLS